jgi:hypothetical protein
VVCLAYVVDGDGCCGVASSDGLQDLQLVWLVDGPDARLSLLGGQLQGGREGRWAAGGWGRGAGGISQARQIRTMKKSKLKAGEGYSEHAM